MNRVKFISSNNVHFNGLKICKYLKVITYLVLLEPILQNK